MHGVHDTSTVDAEHILHTGRVRVRDCARDFVAGEEWEAKAREAYRRHQPQGPIYALLDLDGCCRFRRRRRCCSCFENQHGIWGNSVWGLGLKFRVYCHERYVIKQREGRLVA